MLIFNCKCFLQLKTNYKNQSQMTIFVLAIKFRVTISRLKSFQGYKKTNGQKWHILYLSIFKKWSSLRFDQFSVIECDFFHTKGCDSWHMWGKVCAFTYYNV